MEIPPAPLFQRGVKSPPFAKGDLGGFEFSRPSPCRKDIFCASLGTRTLRRPLAAVVKPLSRLEAPDFPAPSALDRAAVPQK
jgi:hypothetical protein